MDNRLAELPEVSHGSIKVAKKVYLTENVPEDCSEEAPAFSYSRIIAETMKT